MTDPGLLLVDLISPARPVTQATLDGLGEADWLALCTIADQHRLRPLLLHILGQRNDIALPDWVMERWRDGGKRRVLRMLAHQQSLLQWTEALSAAGIDVLCLKGAFLAAHSYPEPTLRPLRDIDLLVPRNRALEAFNLLLAQGASRMPGYDGDPEAVMATGKHELPALRSANGVIVEIHTHLFHATGGDEHDLASDPGLWTRAIERTVAGRALRYPSPPDQLLHLIEHAVHGHGFSNGPLILSDIGYLLGRETIDWRQFWRLAERFDAERAAVLTLRLAERHWGPLGIDYADGPDLATVSDPLLDTAARLTVRDLAHREVVFAHRRYGARGGWRALGLGFRRLFRSRAEVAAYQGGDAGSARILLSYPVILWRGLTLHLPNMLKGRRNAAVLREVDDLTRLGDWLGSPPQVLEQAQ